MLCRVYAVVTKNRAVGANKRRIYKVVNVADGVSPDSPIFGRRVGLPDSAEQAREWGMTQWKGKEESLKDVAAFPYESTLSINDKVEWAGSCFYLKVNAPIGSTRGWSDLLPSMDWIDAHDQYLFANVKKAINAGKYILDVLLEGMTESQQREWLEKNRTTFESGDWFTHNETVAASFMVPDLKMDDTSTFGEMLKNQSLAGVGHPPIWYGESGASRASAPEMTEPSFKRIRARQREYAYLVSEVFRFCVDMAEVQGYLNLDGRLTVGSEKDMQARTFYLRMPDVSAKDQRMLSIAVMNVSTSLKTMMEIGALQAEDVERLFKRYIELLGFDVWKQEPKSMEVVGDPMFDIDKIFASVTQKAGIEEAEVLKLPPVHRDEISTGGSTYYAFRDQSRRSRSTLRCGCNNRFEGGPESVQ